ncbi:MAG: hypothetical protein F3742_08950 [Nitrospinae bacterium]|nr:hypothetical protein [Nitrospinota bacterium]
MEKELLKTLLIEDDEDDAFYIKDILNQIFKDTTLHIDHVSSIEKNLKEIDPFSYNLADTGGGIEENGIEKIFEPFFTTKPEGIGLGLSISYSIIERHGGNMEIESAFGVGTSVIINLPIQS